MQILQQRVGMMRHVGKWILPGLLALFFAGYVLYPLMSLSDAALHDSGSVSGRIASLGDLASRGTIEAAGNSVLVSILSVVFGGLVGLVLSVALTQFVFPFRRVLAMLAIVPIALPPLVGVVAFMFVFGETGILPRLLGQLTGIPASTFSLDGIPAIVAVHVYSFNAFFYVFTSASLARIDGSLVDAAGNLGAGPARIFRSVLLPEVRPSLYGAAILTFLSSLASFSAPLLFAGSHRFLTLEIYATKINGDLALASRQSILLLVVSLICFVAMNVISGSSIPLRRSKGTARVGVWKVPGLLRALLIGLALVIVSIELLPVFIILLVSFAGEGSWTSQLLPSQYTL